MTTDLLYNNKLNLTKNIFGIKSAMGCICGKETITINNRKYYVLSRLGEGGFSLVDLIEDIVTHKVFALKRIDCHLREDEQEAFQEANLYQSYNHQNIIQCIDTAVISSTDNLQNVIQQVVLLLPFYKRGTLQDELERRYKKQEFIKEERILRLFYGICKGVQELHQSRPNPIVHRDLKPANVLLTDDDVPVLMDFGSAGLARVEIKSNSEAIALQDLAAQKCSMPYRAPELFNVQSYSTIDERIDIWSLGCVLYALCFFKSPFEAVYERGDSIALAVIAGTVKIPEDSQYSQQIHELILSMLKVNPAERPSIDWVLMRINVISNSAENKV